MYSKIPASEYQWQRRPAVWFLTELKAVDIIATLRIEAQDEKRLKQHNNEEVRQRIRQFREEE